MVEPTSRCSLVTQRPAAYIQLNNDATPDEVFEPQELRIVVCDKNTTVLGEVLVRIPKRGGDTVEVLATEYA